MITLHDAILITDSVKRRLALRALAMPFIRVVDPLALKNVFAESPLVGDGPAQVNIRPTHSGLRDALDEDTLLALADIGSPIMIDHILSAIHRPDMYGVADSSKKSGFAFGRPSEVTETLINTIKGRLMTTSSATAPAAAKTTAALNEIVSALAYVLTVDGAKEDDAYAAIGRIYSEQMMRAAKTSLGVIDREEWPDIAEQAPFEIIDAIRSWLHKPESHAPATPVAAATYTKPKPEIATAIDAVLGMAKLPGIEKLIDELNAATAKVVELERVKSSTIVVATASEMEAHGEIPKGKVVTRKATDVFGITKAKDMFNFDVPVFEWDGRHPHVPALDENYIFRPYELFRALWSLITNKRAWLTGHSGTGKTSLCEQIAARLNWPTIVVNFDSEISRMDLIGRETLINDGGTTVSKFIDGVLPMAMQGPYVLICDEIDFVRSDVSYVLQRALQGDGMVLTEDGGRIVRPHPMFRIQATGNTKGQGDETGLYPGARQQTEAFRDRFTCWINVEYLNEEERMQLIRAKVNGIDDPTALKLNKYATEHMTAFKGAQVIQPLTPRGIISLGEALVHFAALFPKHASKEAVTQAFNTVVLDRASPQDAVVLKGIVDRVFG
jgi:cobaltochelatase CobS